MKSAKTKLGQWIKRSMQTAYISYETGQPVEKIIEERNNNSSRRKFISNAATLATVGFALNGISSCTKNIEGITENTNSENILRSNKNKKSVAIIGAGIAGLNAATILKENGIDADVFEAASRVGGRMFTAYNIMAPNLSTELGGEFIDTDHAEIRGLAAKYNLELIDTAVSSESSFSDTLYFNGVHYTEVEAAKEFLKLLPKIIPDKNSLSANITAFNHTQTDAYFDNLTITQYLDRIGSTGWFREAMISLQLSENGASPDEQSALNFLLYADVSKANGILHVYYSDERFKIKGGNQQLPILMADALGNQVKYNHQLDEVKTNGNAYTLLFTTTNSEKISFNYDVVLFAIPFTILKKIKLNVPLPQWKRDVINEHGYGNNSKLLIGFKKRYWRDDGLNGGFLTDNKTQGGWDNSQLQPGTAGGITIYKCSNEAVALGEGTVAQQVAENLPLLDKILPGAIINFNGRAERMVWPTYKYSMASYSCYKPGQYTTLLGKQIVPVDHLFFAGEHCSINYWGYMNGAAETGRASALLILRNVFELDKIIE